MSSLKPDCWPVVVCRWLCEGRGVTAAVNRGLPLV
jgi:hypothetical protein